jgi:hypothetical protein
VNIIEYEEGTQVLVRYPAPGMTHLTSRETWPWYPGTIEEKCGPDEWLVAMESRDVATAEDGSPAPANADDDDVWFPVCFRDSTEIREAAE